MDGSGRYEFDFDQAVDPPRPGTTAWPRISDYWPDRAPRAAESPEKPSPDTGSGRHHTEVYETLRQSGRHLAVHESGVHRPPPDPARRRIAVTAAGAIVLIGIGAAGLLRLVSTTHDEIPFTATPPVEVVLPQGFSPPAPPPVANPSPARTPTKAATRTRTTTPAETQAPPGPAFPAGTFVLTADAAEVNLTLGRPPDGTVRVTTPPGSGLTTSGATSGTTVTLTAEPAGPPGSRRLNVELDDRIDWAIRLSGSVATGNLTLTGGTVREIDLAAGANTVNLTLPPTDAALPIRMTGGVHTWRIHTGQEEPVRVRIGTGADEVTLYGERTAGPAKGTELTAGTGPGLEIDAAAGVGSLTVSP